MDTTYDDGLVKPQAAWGAVFSMALCVAILIASEFMPVSLLTPIADGVAITEGRAGRAISISGVFALFTYLRPFLETVTGVGVSALSDGGARPRFGCRRYRSWKGRAMTLGFITRRAILQAGGYRWSRGLIRLGHIDGGFDPLLACGKFPLRIERIS